MIEINFVKNYLKVDFTEDDELINMLIDISKGYVETEIGKKLSDFEEIPKQIELAMLLLISYWYEERTAMSVVKNKTLSTEVKYGVSSILNPFKIRQL